MIAARDPQAIELPERTSLRPTLPEGLLQQQFAD
jgi:hypothetical protein